MAEDNYFKIVYPSGGTEVELEVSVDAEALRRMGQVVTLMPAKLKLGLVPREELPALSQKASPHRFERADIAARFLTARPERGDAKFWTVAAEKDAALGEAVVLVDPLVEWSDDALAVTLAKLSGFTGSIERTVDKIDAEPGGMGETSAFRVADLERDRLDADVASLRERVEGHLAGGEAQAQGAALEDRRELAKKVLKDVDPRRLLQTKHTVKSKKGE